MEATTVVEGGSSGRDRSLLEREADLQLLERLVDAVAEGEHACVLIDGPAGIGKSSLLAEVGRLGRESGLRVLSARAGELEREFAFGVVRQLLEPVVDVDEIDSGGGVFLGAAAPARAVFDPAGTEPADAHGHFATLNGLYWLVANASEERPIAVLIDDLHWCDLASLQALGYALRRLEGLAVIVAATLRSSEPGADPNLIAELAADPATTVLHPAPLSEGASAELVRGRLGSGAEPAFSAACYNATGGNPLLLDSLLKAMEAEGVEPVATSVDAVSTIGPKAVSRSVGVRLAALPAEATEVGRAIAVLGDGAEVTRVAALTGLDEERVAELIAALAEAEILRESPPLGFVHPLIRDVLYDGLRPGQRELAHERAAKLLSDAGAPEELVATQMLKMPARGDAWVYETLRAVGQQTMAQGAAVSAVAYLRRALSEPPPPQSRPTALLELGLAEAMTNAAAAGAHLREALQLHEEPLLRALIANALCRVVLFRDDPTGATELARRIAAEMPPELEDQRLALEAFEAATAWFGSECEQALERLNRFPGPEAVGSLGTQMIAAVAAVETVAANGSRERAIGLAHAAMGEELIAADSSYLAIYAIIALLHADDPDVDRVWERMIAEGRRSGSLFSISAIHMWHAHTLYLHGALAEAEEELRESISEIRLYGYADRVDLYIYSHLALILIERGEIEEARRALAGLELPAAGTDAARYLLNARMRLGEADGDAEAVIEAADEFQRLLPRFQSPAHAHWRSSKAAALDLLGRDREALALADEEVELARHWGAPATLGRSLRVRGAIRREQGIADLEEACEVLEASTNRLEHAKALAALGGALRRARRPSDSREPLRRALEIADSCSAAALIEHVRSELRASGVRPRRSALSGVESLTASELRVAELAAEGKTNRDIAQQLFVTQKTVEVHLTNTYRKLDIGSRRELPAALAADG